MYRRSSLVLAALSCLVLGLPMSADEAAVRPSGQPGTREYVQTEGRRLVQAGQWQRAADVFGIWFHPLSEAVAWEWYGARDKPPRERDRYRFDLVNFYFRHMSFVQGGWRADIGRILEYAKEYPQIVARLPAAETSDVLDFSHVELLESMVQPYSESKLTRDEHGARVFTAVESDPESIPALVAMMLLVDTLQSGKPLLAWEDAERLAPSPWARLTLARTVAAKHGVSLETKRRIIERGWRLAPTAEEKAMLLYRGAEAVAGSTRGRSAQQVESVLEATRPIYRQFPLTRFAANARQLAVSALADAGRIEESLSLVRDLQSQGEEQRGGLDRALFHVSQVHFKREQYDDSEALLREVVRDYADTPTASRAMLGLAEVCAARKDFAQERDWLLKCAEFNQTDPTGRGIMDTDNTRSLAHQRLAAAYERDGQWTEAHRWWSQWSPASWCGTCEGSMRASRFQHLAMCKLRLGEHEAAVRYLFEAFEDGSAEWSPKCAELLFEVYRRADQLDELMTIADQLDEPRKKSWRERGYYQNMSPSERQKQLPTWPLRRLKQIAELGRQEDIAQLQAICLAEERGFEEDLSNPRSGWANHAAAVELARCGEDAVVSIRNAVRGEENLRPYRWLLCALGKSSSPAAFPLLKELAAAKSSYGYGDLVQAIALRGEPGLALIRQWADEDDRLRSLAARVYLKGMPKERASAAPWPAPVPGSLPGTLPGSGTPRARSETTGKTATGGTTASVTSPLGSHWLVAVLVMVVVFLFAGVYARRRIVQDARREPSR
jgi:tetratricopeptide (TPR) repeat protein